MICFIRDEKTFICQSKNLSNGMIESNAKSLINSYICNAPVHTIVQVFWIFRTKLLKNILLNLAQRQDFKIVRETQ